MAALETVLTACTNHLRGIMCQPVEMLSLLLDACPRDPVTSGQARLQEALRISSSVEITSHSLTVTLLIVLATVGKVGQATLLASVLQAMPRFDRSFAALALVLVTRVVETSAAVTSSLTGSPGAHVSRPSLLVPTAAADEAVATADALSGHGNDKESLSSSFTVGITGDVNLNPRLSRDAPPTFVWGDTIDVTRAVSVMSIQHESTLAEIPDPNPQTIQFEDPLDYTATYAGAIAIMHV